MDMIYYHQVQQVVSAAEMYHHRRILPMNIERSLKFWKKETDDDMAQKSTTSTTINSEFSIEETSEGSSTSPPHYTNVILAPSIIYAGYTIFSMLILYEIMNEKNILLVSSTSLGEKALALTVIGLIWDNLVITVGSLFFRDVEDDKSKYDILKALSWPRFTLHATLPLECITVAELGKAAEVGFLQSYPVQAAIIVASIVLVRDNATFRCLKKFCFC